MGLEMIYIVARQTKAGASLREAGADGAVPRRTSLSQQHVLHQMSSHPHHFSLLLLLLSVPKIDCESGMPQTATGMYGLTTVARH